MVRVRWTVSLALLGLLCAPLSCAPAAETLSYSQTGFRLEARPDLTEVANPATRAAVETALAQAGVQARWIRTTTNRGDPLFTNPFLPCPDPGAAPDHPGQANEATLKAWVEEIHAQGMVAITWINSRVSESTAGAHPDWRQVFVGGDQPPRPALCPLTGWGDALIGFCNYAIERLGLDGVYLDGAFWSPLLERPRALTCRCASCQARFRADTGQEIPTTVAWENPVFRRWVAWRYQVYSGYYARLAKEIHAAHPNAVVLVNNYHRPEHTWRTGMPLDLFPAEYLYASEGHTPPMADIVTRLGRAYGRAQVETWGILRADGDPAARAETPAQIAAYTYLAGGVPSFGTMGGWAAPQYAATAALLSPMLKGLRPHLGGQSAPYAALHVSQQTETFHFGRAPADSNFTPFWTSLQVWNAGLEEAHVPTDFLFDGDLTAAKLASYKVLLLPLSLALSPAQAQIVAAYAQGGGTVLLGVGAGQVDAEGQRAAENPLGKAFGFSFATTPGPEGTDVAEVQVAAAGQPPLPVAGMYSALTTAGAEWKPLFTDQATGRTLVAERPWGTGHVLVAAIDPASVLAPQAEFDSQTEALPADNTAAGGKWSLKFVDGAVTSRADLPSLTASLPTTYAATAQGGEVHLDLRLETGADVLIRFRSALDMNRGIPVRLGGARGRVLAGGRALAPVPYGRWLHLDMSYTFARGGQQAKYSFTLTGPEGFRQEDAGVEPRDAGHDRTDYLEILSPATTPGAFYVDNLQIVQVGADGAKQTVVNEDFEEGGATVLGRTALVRRLAARLQELAPPPVRLEAPEYVHLGLYQAAEGRLLAHLHNTRGRLGDWQAPTGPAVKLHCAFPVQGAKLAISGQPLTVRAREGGAEIEVPALGLYQVVEIQR